ncbi:hypothetical protein PIB30_071456 [Stylosanthes scabra]|uniref:Uncharacterized protein n=1 Tax=Stylosanthes scabra TaxID=79078 RepID=A0ABU6ZMG1_9FABA|nr:hypothetical protein [Stylosanthes scabra]
MAHPHASRTRAMALARPRGELGHIRPKLPSSTARAFAQWPWCVRALALGALGKGPGRVARPRAPNGTPTRAHYHAFLGPHCMARSRPRHGAPARWRLHLKAECTPLFSHSHSQFLSSSPIPSIRKPSISHTNTHTSSLCVISLTSHRQVSFLSLCFSLICMIS